MSGDAEFLWTGIPSGIISTMSQIMADRAEGFDRFYRLADERNLRMGELLEQALEAFEKG